MKGRISLFCFIGLVGLLAGCSSGETLDPKDSVAGQLKGLKNEPYQGRDAGMPKVDKDDAKTTKKPAPKGGA